MDMKKNQSDSNSLAPGKYLHVKGKFYDVITTGLRVNNGQPESQEVVYKNEAGDIFIRSLSEFTEPVAWPGGKVRPRWIYAQVGDSPTLPDWVLDYFRDGDITTNMIVHHSLRAFRAETGKDSPRAPLEDLAYQEVGEFLPTLYHAISEFSGKNIKNLAPYGRYQQGDVTYLTLQSAGRHILTIKNKSGAFVSLIGTDTIESTRSLYFQAGCASPQEYLDLLTYSTLPPVEAWDSTQGKVSLFGVMG